MTDEGIRCATHGTADAAYVCQHLVGSQDAGFHYSAEPQNLLFPDAWCDACDEVCEQEDGWNERSEAFAGVRLICSHCYLEARRRNWPADTHDATDALIETAMAYLHERQADLRARFKLSEHERYDWDQETGRLVFSNSGVPAVEADVQFVGSVSTRSNTWLWAWANESLLETVKAQVRRVREHGEEHQMLALSCAYWEAEEADGWAMAGVTAFLLQAQGVYRTPEEHGLTFMVLTDVRWAQSGEPR